MIERKRTDMELNFDGRRVAVDYTVPNTLTVSSKEPRGISTTPMKCEMQHKLYLVLGRLILVGLLLVHLGLLCLPGLLDLLGVVHVLLPLLLMLLLLLLLTLHWNQRS